MYVNKPGDGRTFKEIEIKNLYFLVSRKVKKDWNMNQLLINVRESEKRILLINNNVIQNLYIEQPEQESLIGNIYIGIVERVVPSMEAAFVNIGKGKKGYLHFSQTPVFIKNKFEGNVDKRKPYIHQGEKILVQIIKDETDTKYYRLTGNIEFTSESVILMPYGHYVAVSKKLSETLRQQLRDWAINTKHDTEGYLFRTQAEQLTEERFLETIDELREEHNKLILLAGQVKAPALLKGNNSFLNEIIKLKDKFQLDEVICDDLQLVKQLKEIWTGIHIEYYHEKMNIFSHYFLNKELEKLQKKVVWLDNGANIVIEEKEAFTIIDVNSAKASGQKRKDETIRKTNMLAAREIARQVRLRNIGGNIFIDFINMTKDQDREAIIRLLKKEFEWDQERTIIFGFTNLGILEMSRKRTKPSLQQKMMVHCPTCQGTGFVESSATVAFQLERELWGYKDQDYMEVIIEVTEDVLQFFTGEHKEHFMKLEHTLGFTISFEIFAFPKPHFHIKRLVN